MFRVMKGFKFSTYIRKFVDIDRIRQNKIKFEKFKKLTADTHNAHTSLKISSRSPFLMWSTSFLLLNMANHTDLLLPVFIACILYFGHVFRHALIFRRYMFATPVPPDLENISPAWIRRLDYKNDKGLYLVTGAGNAVSESVSSGPVRKFFTSLPSKSKDLSGYVSDPKNLPIVALFISGFITIVGGSDYLFAEANSRTTLTTRVVESATNGTYSPDPDTRTKAAALRRRGVSLVDCCEPNSRCLNPGLIEEKYEEFKPYEPKRYRILEQQIENHKLELEQKEQQTSVLEAENRKLRLRLEGPDLT
jgi:hypothetical protein